MGYNRGLGGPEINHFGSPFFGHHYYILHLADQCPSLEKIKKNIYCVRWQDAFCLTKLLFEALITCLYFSIYTMKKRVEGSMKGDIQFLLILALFID